MQDAAAREANATTGPPVPPLFALENVTVRRGAAVVLDDVTADIPPGACTTVVGKSGAGKSTLLRLLNRLAEPASGRILLDGRPLPELDVLALRRRVGLVSQAPVLLTDHILSDLRVGCPGLDEERAAALLERAGLPAAMLGRGTAGLSGGEAQRVCLARALAVGPEVLLADEPTSALDPASAAAVEASIDELVAGGTAVVLVSHDAAQARWLADYVLVLDHGRLAEHGPAGEVGYLREERT